MLNPDEVLTFEDVAKRFRKVFQRDMTAEEQRAFFFYEELKPQAASNEFIRLLTEANKML